MFREAIAFSFFHACVIRGFGLASGLSTSIFSAHVLLSHFGSMFIFRTSHLVARPLFRAEISPIWALYQTLVRFFAIMVIFSGDSSVFSETWAKNWSLANLLGPQVLIFFFWIHLFHSASIGDVSAYIGLVHSKSTECRHRAKIAKISKNGILFLFPWFFFLWKFCRHFRALKLLSLNIEIRTQNKTIFELWNSQNGARIPKSSHYADR